MARVEPSYRDCQIDQNGKGESQGRIDNTTSVSVRD